MRLAPKWVLRNALASSLEQLEVRFSNHPLRMITERIDPSGNLTAQLQFCESENGKKGNALLRMNIPGNRFYAEGSIADAQKAMGLMLYLDPSEMVIGVGPNSDKAAYGIRYDRFSDDIRKIPFLSLLAGDSVFDTWEKRLVQIKNAVSYDISVPNIPTVSDEVTHTILLGILYLPCSVEKLPCPDGCGHCCYRIQYRITPESLEKVWHGLKETWDVSFLLYKKSLVQVDAASENDTAFRSYRISWVEDPASGPLEIEAKTIQNGVARGFSLYADTKVGKNHISETWKIRDSFSEEDGETVFSYTWYPKSGDLSLQLLPHDPVSLLFVPDGNGFYCYSKEWSRILAGVKAQWGKQWEGKTLEGSVTVRNGEPFENPRCKYPDQWSLEEVLQLLTDLKAISSF